ncbi:GNAT family N-acetyltransferase [Paracoccus zhejiangensis]|uniref:GNAT family N-acetyltransferase n=1 Tax=Paracoccus zhejiangensis TaxID=1077935 RepID=A0A2H5EXB6_9RHOB|nr:GNAT family N-acetyltransferase [Paracoccus zhejiangensis]AUH63927.1 GNAT family N-acetyltransferase [Paracoccus zhejiangensis]
MDESRLTIRRAIKADIPQLLELYRHLIPGDEQPTEAQAGDAFARFLTYAGSAIFLGELNDVLVASCALVVVPNLTRGAKPFGLIENVVTHSDHRNCGYGRQILDAASESAWASGCYKVMLMTGSQKPSTLSFYLAAGFEQSKTGFQKRRFPVRSEI